MQEIMCGNYKIVEDKPLIVSALGAVPKDDSDIRLIHDCSLPEGRAVNDYATYQPFSLQSFDGMVAMVTPDSYMCKVDLRAAYRSVLISEQSQRVTGLKWTFKGDKKPTFLVDTALPFGARASPGIFNRITQAVCRMMHRKGFTRTCAYLDDFAIVMDTFGDCLRALNTLLALLIRLGFLINYKKVFGPTQCMTFLGIEINSVEMTIRLPQQKLVELQGALQDFLLKRRASKRQLQQLIGRLNWASRVVHGGRTFLRRLIDVQNGLRQANHKVIIQGSARADVEWWADFLATFNGKSLILDSIPVDLMSMDACNMGGGAVFGRDWFYILWQEDWPQVQHMHINFKEVLVIIGAARRWAACWANKRVRVFTDSTAAQGIINKGSCTSPIVMAALRELFWLSAKYNFHIVARHIAGSKNNMADWASRLHEHAKLCHLDFNLYPPCVLTPERLLCHMSLNAFLFLSPQIATWWRWKQHWIGT